MIQMRQPVFEKSSYQALGKGFGELACTREACGASNGLLDFVRRSDSGIRAFNGIEDEEHKITVLEVSRYWGHIVGTETGKKLSEAKAMYHDLVDNHKYSHAVAMEKIGQDLSPTHANLYQGSKTTGKLHTLASAFGRADYDYDSLDLELQVVFNTHMEKYGEEELIAKLKRMIGGHDKLSSLHTLASAYGEADYNFDSLDLEMQAEFLRLSDIEGEEELVAKLKRMSEGQHRGANTTGKLHTLASAFGEADYNFDSLDLEMQALYNKHMVEDGEEELVAKLKRMHGGHDKLSSLNTLASAYGEADYNFDSLDLIMQAEFLRLSDIEGEEELIAKLKRMSEGQHRGANTTGELNTLSSAYGEADYNFDSLDLEMQALYNKHMVEDGEEELVAKLKRMHGGHDKLSSLNTLASAYGEADYNFDSLDLIMQAEFHRLSDIDGEEELIAKLKRMHGGQAVKQGKLVCSMKDGKMKIVLQKYFVEGQVLKPSTRFLEQNQQECADVSRYLLCAAIESIPGLDSIKRTIKARSPLSKEGSEIALSIIHEHFREPLMEGVDQDVARASKPIVTPVQSGSRAADLTVATGPSKRLKLSPEAQSRATSVLQAAIRSAIHDQDDIVAPDALNNALEAGYSKTFILAKVTDAKCARLRCIFHKSNNDKRYDNGEWRCGTCTFLNEAHREHCEHCSFIL